MLSVPMVRRTSPRGLNLIRNASSQHDSLLRSWPQSQSPTPYEILSISQPCNPSMLKSHFYKLAKIYHPDSSAFGEEQLSGKLKNERFKQILAAYNLLKDPVKRNNYDTFKAGWNDNRKTQYTRSYGNNAFDKQNFQDHHYYYAGTWEDFERMKKGQNFTTAQQFEKNKHQILYAVVAFGVVTALLELSFALGTSDEQITLQSNLHEKCRQDLQSSYDNHGFDLGKISRINRFLLFRQFEQLIYGKKEGGRTTGEKETAEEAKLKIKVDNNHILTLQEVEKLSFQDKGSAKHEK